MKPEEKRENKQKEVAQKYLLYLFYSEDVKKLRALLMEKSILKCLQKCLPG